MYDRIIDLRIATPQIIINYAMFLEEHNYFEDSFKVREFNSVYHIDITFCFVCYCFILLEIVFIFASLFISQIIFVN